MIKVNIHEAKTHLSSLLKLLDRGETILICKRNVPVAEILPVRSRSKRAFGLEKGAFTVPDSFFEPLPDDLLKAFYFENEDSD